VDVRSIFLFITALTFLSVGIYICRKGPRLFGRIPYGLHVFSVGLWSFGLSMFYVSRSMEMSLFWGKFLYFIGSLVAATFLYFSLTISSDKKSISKYKGMLVFLPNIILLVLFTLTSFMLKEARMINGYKGFIYGDGRILWDLVFAAQFILATCILANLYRKRTCVGITKMRIKYILWATWITLLLAGATNVIMPWLKRFELLWAGPLFAYLWLFCILYAITRYRILDVKIVIARALIFGFVYVPLLSAPILFTFWKQGLIEDIFGKYYWLVPTLFGMAISVGGLSIYLGVQRGTEKKLLQEEYKSREVLDKISDKIVHILDVGEASELITDRCYQGIEIDYVGVYVLDKIREEYWLRSHKGLKCEVLVLKKEDLLIRCLMQRRYLLLKDELRDLKAKDVREIKKMRGYVFIPCFRYKELLGVIVLGEKKSEKLYTQLEFDALRTLANQTALMIESVQLFEKLSVAQAQAAQREKMAVIGTLSAGINHEICNPLSIIRGQCETFVLNLKEGLYKSKSSKELLGMANDIMGKVIDETDRATIITRKLSSFAKPAERKSKNDIRLVDELDEVISLVQYELKMSNVAILKEIEDGLPFVSADPKQLQEIFFNTIRNAAQAIEESGSITIRAKSGREKIYIDIEDTGLGMDEEQLKQIFNPFFTTKNPGEGTGLGLFIVKQITEKNGGEITIESEPGKGTVVHLTFNAAA
jgi:two-component system NtrC family sensor kinase